MSGKVFARGLAMVMVGLPALAQQGAAVPRPSSPCGQSVTSHVRVSGSLAKDTFRPLEPVLLTIEIDNGLEERIVLPNDHNKYCNYYIIVRDRLGERVTGTAYSSRFTGGTGGYPNELLPGRKSRRILSANLMADMTAPGEYSITVEVDVWVGYREGHPPIRVRSKPVRVKVEGAPFGAPE